MKDVYSDMPVDRDGKPIPWYVYAAIDFLSPRIAPDMRVFEYGSGNSTLWWGERVVRLVSCEHDPVWFRRMGEQVPDSVEYIYRELARGGKYSKAILEYGHAFDIVVIDGRDRVNCAVNCLGALSGNGVIVWDNSDRRRYADGYSRLLEKGFKRLDFSGRGPVEKREWSTAIFYRANNCLGII